MSQQYFVEGLLLSIGWASRSISHRQGHGCDNGNKFNQPSQPPFHHNARGHWQRDPAAGPSKPYHQGPAALNKMPMKKWSRQKASQALVVSSPNNIHILPTLSSKIDQEQENCADSAGAPEHSMSPTLNGVEGNTAMHSIKQELIQVTRTPT